MQNATHTFTTCIIVIFLLASPTHADIARGDDDLIIDDEDIFTDLDEWLAAVPPVTVIDFTDFPPNTLITDQYSDLGVTFEPHNNIASFIANNSGYIDEFGLANNAGRIIMQFEQPLHFIGALFPGALAYELYLEGELVGLTEFQGCLAGVECFAGLILESPFDEVHIFRTTFVSIDNLYFTFAPIPAPGAAAPLLALLAIFGHRRRRQ